MNSSEENRNEILKALQKILGQDDAAPEPVILDLNSIIKNKNDSLKVINNYIKNIAKLSQREVIIKTLGKIEVLKSLNTINYTLSNKMSVSEYSYWKASSQSIEEVENLLLWLVIHQEDDELKREAYQKIFNLSFSTDDQIEEAPDDIVAEQEDECEDNNEL